ncbi:TonB-dependent receptor [Gilvimarinus japonicus]|uniref:TonB-dependent receptor n=1 Tax=Gilvimarinus japonicus TaxID=1796469 RepID=A0ABV7HQN6_9GAMM
MKSFTPKALTVALALASIHAAQVSAQQEPTNLDSESLEEVVVTGIRASLIKSQAVKENSTTIVEAITAEDIGKLPDPSIAETIARLPGLSARRVDGRASAISMRGLNEDYIATTFNGREQVSIGDNRGVDFSLYPAEIMGGVTVHKVASASLTTQGIAGVIDMQSVKPLATGEQVIKIGGLYEENSLGQLNPDGEDSGYRVTGSYIDQFADDTVGVAVTINSISSPNQEERWNAWGGTEWPTDDAGNIILGGAKPYVRSGIEDRNTIMGVLEYQPNDQLHITADALYIDYSVENILRGIEIPARWGAGITMDTLAVEDGFVTEGVINGVRPVVRNDYSRNDAELGAFGLNIEYNITDNTMVELDVSHSQVERDGWLMESYAGSGRGDGVGPADNIGFTMNDSNYGVTFSPGHDYSDPDLYMMGGALSWGGGNTLYDAADDQDGFISTIDLDDELSSFKLSVSHQFDGWVKSVEGGVYYTEREKVKRDSGTFLTLPSYPEMTRVPDEYLLPSASLEFIGMGNMLSYDAFGFYQDGNYIETSEDLTATFRATNSWSVSESVTTAYIQADFAGDLTNHIVLTGNVGVQAVNTDQSSNGNAASNDDQGLVVITPVSGGADYTDVLPSLSLNLNMFDDHWLRMGATKTMSRARMDRMNASLSYGFNEVLNTPSATIEASPWSANGGNPELRPQVANTYDLSYEYYFAADGYVSIAAFYKDLESWQVSTRTDYDFSAIAPPNGQVAEFNQGYYWQWDNADGGTIEGTELSVSLPGHLIHESMDGFGLTASATYLDSSIEVEGQEANIPGLSDSMYNLTAYYENYGWQLRASMRQRDDFPAELGYDADPVLIAGSTVVDAQIGYDFSESGIDALDGLTLSLQVYNLTDEPFSAYASGDPRLVRDYQVYGTNYLLSASYRF